MSGPLVAYLPVNPQRLIFRLTNTGRQSNAEGMLIVEAPHRDMCKTGNRLAVETKIRLIRNLTGISGVSLNVLVVAVVPREPHAPCLLERPSQALPGLDPG